MRLWFDAAERWGIGDALVHALGQSRVVARGPKARSACRQRGLEVMWSAPNESMPEVVSWLSDQPDISTQTLAVQLFDPEDHPSTADLRSLAGDVIEVPIYRWRHPDDRAPAFALIEQIVEGRLDAVTFTSQPAVRFLFEMAAEVGRAEHLAEAFNDGKVLPVCIGPVNAEALTEVGVTTSVWPEPNRLVAMVKLATERLAGS
jgi:uroporphyrinogen-III synthase